MPTSSNNPLAVSTSEWMASDIMAELPLTAAVNFVTAMA